MFMFYLFQSRDTFSFYCKILYNLYLFLITENKGFRRFLYLILFSNMSQDRDTIVIFFFLINKKIGTIICENPCHLWLFLEG